MSGLLLPPVNRPFFEVDGLRPALAWASQEVLIKQAARVSRLIQVHTDASAPPPDRVRELGRLLLDHV